MIKNKSMGLVIAENDDEVAWFNEAENLKQEIKALKLRIKNAEKDLKLSARELEQRFKAGAKKSIKMFKQGIKVRKNHLNASHF